MSNKDENLTLCTPQKKASACLFVGFASADKLGQGEMGGVTCRVLCTWVAASLCYKRVMVGTSWATSHLDSMDMFGKLCVA